MILEILIPTYRRPIEALRAIDSVIQSNDKRVGVACHSNGIEPYLEAEILHRPVVRYNSFSKNLGVVANLRELLSESRAEYVMFLSDEDSIAINYLSNFVDFLSQGDYGFIFCSVIDFTGKNYFSISPLHRNSLTLDEVLMLFPIDPTYLSGYCFKRDLITMDLILKVFDDNHANVYPHLILRNEIINHGKIGIFPPNLIIKGRESKSGGDSHSHLEGRAETSKARDSIVLGLNPRIYGPAARVAQFAYMSPLFDSWFATLPLPKRVFGMAYLLSAWLKITSDAGKLTLDDVDPENISIVIDGVRHTNESANLLFDLFSSIILIRHQRLKFFIINLFWGMSKIIKLALFFRYFGIAQSIAFLKSKYG